MIVKMGSKGWVKCYWCELKIHNGYIVKWNGEPLCGPCNDKMRSDHGPRRPTAICHKANVIRMVIGMALPRNIDETIIRHIAAFLEDVYRPGAGSRQTPPSHRPPQWRGADRRLGILARRAATGGRGQVTEATWHPV